MIKLTDPGFDEVCTSLARSVVDQLYNSSPGFSERYGAAHRPICEQDIRFHLTYLLSAVVAEEYPLFKDYIGWVKILFNELGIPNEHMIACLDVIDSVVGARDDVVSPVLLHDFIRNAKHSFNAFPDKLKSFIDPAAPSAGLAGRYLACLLETDRYSAEHLIMDAVAGGMLIKDVYLHIFQPAMYDIGRLWQIGAISVAQEHYCTAATQMIMARLYPQIFKSTQKGRRLVATCVNGEQHELGIRMLADIFELDGWDTHFLGANMPKSGIIKLITDIGADVLAISATITANVPHVAELIAAVRAGPSRAPSKSAP